MAKIADDIVGGSGYAFMMSAGIAMLGLLISSSAVVTGAMLV